MMRPMRLVVPLCVVCAACTAPTGGGADTGGAAGDTGGDTGGDSDDTGSPATPLEPDWAPEEVATAFAAAVATGVPSPKTVRDVYFDLLARGADATCPGSDQLDGANPLGCTSEQGYFFAGFSSWLQQDTGNGDEWMLSGDFVIRDPDDLAFEVGGHALHRLQADSSHTIWRSEYSGWWRREGAGGWLGEGTSSLFRTDGTIDPGGETLLVSGGLTWSGLSVYFDQAKRAPSSCGPAYTGSVQLRDATGGWWKVALDGTCEPCGALDFAGGGAGSGGTTCLDLDGFFDALTADLATP